MQTKIVSLKNREFIKVYQSGYSKVNKYLIMYIMKTNKYNRIGISVSKKVGNSVVRHRVKRLINETYRLHNNHIEDGYDIVIVARNTAKGRSYKEIESAFLHLLKLNKIFVF